MTDPIRGRTFRWTFEDGPTRGTTFEHTFGEDGTVTYRTDGKVTTEKTYTIAPISDDVIAVSYLASSGWTLTSVLDFRTGRITSFASNVQQLVTQHGTFEIVGKRAA